MPVTPVRRKNPEEGKTHSKLFTACDYITKLRGLDRETQAQYLSNHIDSKLILLRQNTSSSTKIQNKIAVLTKLKDVLAKREPILSKTVLLKEHPSAFQSFWREKGDTEVLFDAVTFHFDKTKVEENKKDNRFTEQDQEPQALEC